MKIFLWNPGISKHALILLTVLLSSRLWHVEAATKESRACLDERLSKGDSLTKAVEICGLLEMDDAAKELDKDWRNHVHYRVRSEEAGKIIREAEEDDRRRAEGAVPENPARAKKATKDSSDSASGSRRPDRHRFGVQVFSEVQNIMENATVIHLRNQCKIHRCVIRSSGAQSLSIYWRKFAMPPSGVFVIYSDSHRRKDLHKYNSQSFLNSRSEVFVTHLPGEAAYIEYMETDCVQENATEREDNCSAWSVPPIKVESVIHGYKAALFSVDSSAKDGNGDGSQLACSEQIDINCPLGDNWQDEKRSVVAIISDKTFTCTGALLRSPESSQFSQLLLTAYHCIDPTHAAVTYLSDWQSKVQEIENFWNFRFNYEYEDCGGSETNADQDGFVGPGSKVLGRFVGTDYLLLDIIEPIPEIFNPYFAGWDVREDQPLPSSAVVIHHPAGDAKKISVTSGPFDVTNYDNLGASKSHWRVEYDIGATEPGSSGAPLFDGTTKRIIGQLHGGHANTCSAVNASGLGGDDFYGATFASWTAGMQLILGLQPGFEPFMDGSYGTKQPKKIEAYMMQSVSESQDIIAVQEGAAASPISIKLAYQPSNLTAVLPTVTFPNNSICNAAGLNSCIIPCPSQLFFDSSNWDEPQALMLHAVDDQRMNDYRYPSLNLFLTNQPPESNDPNLDLQGVASLILSDDDCPTKWKIFFPKSGYFPEENSWILRRGGDIIAYGVGNENEIPDGEGSLCAGGNFTITFMDSGRDGIGRDGNGFMKLRLNDTESILLFPSDVSFYYWKFFSFEVVMEDVADSDQSQVTIKGDCNSDGQVGKDDVLQILSWVADDSKICSEHRCKIPINADVNGDSYVSAIDTADLVLS